MSQPDSERPSFEPRWPALIAAVMFVLAAMTLCAPMLGGKFLAGGDQLTAGFGFREFGARMFRETGSIPQWTPFQFGGMPFMAAMHGDIFYPTAWLRWFLPIETAMNIAWAGHIILAGLVMYLFLRALRLGWTAALAGGLAYELTGILTSLVSPGHDGKLFVSALAPLVFFALVRAIRDQRLWGYGLLALVIGLCLLSPHYQMTYYLLVAAGIWTIYLTFFDPERPTTLRWPMALSLATAGVILGLGISGIQAMPFLDYIPFSPRGAGGPSAGWEYATSYAFPVRELFTTVLPQFNGILDLYWGGNFFKAHTEYVGAVVVLLACLSFGAPGRKRLMVALAVIGGLFLLVAFGGHTPFYRLWYEVMPMMKKVRAPGMAFFLVAFVLSVYSAIGVERLIRGDVLWRRVMIAGAVLGVLAILGAAGGLQTVAQALAPPERMDVVARNAVALRTGSLRLLIVVLAMVGVLWLVLRGTIRGAAAAAALAVVIVADLWSIDRLFFQFQDAPATLFRSDAIIDRIKSAKPPFRVFDIGQWSPAGSAVYYPSYLMVHRIQSMLGYHGNEVRFYDDLLGGKNEWRNAINLGLWDILAVRFIIAPDSQPIPGFHLALGPAPTFAGTQAYLYEQDSTPSYVRVASAAAKIPDDRIVATVTDPRYPYESLVLLPDSSSVNPAPIQGAFIPPAPVTATLSDWKPGEMTIALAGAAPRESYLLVSETWYPDWHATVDGAVAPVLRADEALMSVVLPPGAKQVHLVFRDHGYAAGKWVTLISALLTFTLILAPAFARRRATGV